MATLNLFTNIKDQIKASESKSKAEILSRHSIYIRTVSSFKVSKSQKQNCRAKTSSKNERTNLFFYPDGPEILET